MISQWLWQLRHTRGCVGYSLSGRPLTSLPKRWPCLANRISQCVARRYGRFDQDRSPDVGLPFASDPGCVFRTLQYRFKSASIASRCSDDSRLVLSNSSPSVIALAHSGRYWLVTRELTQRSGGPQPFSGIVRWLLPFGRIASTLLQAEGRWFVTLPVTSLMFLTTIEVADRLRISRRTLERMRVEGTGPRYIKVGPGKRSRVLYREVDVVEWINRFQFGSTSEYGR